jgi:hypothetical protein
MPDEFILKASPVILRGGSLFFFFFFHRTRKEYRRYSNSIMMRLHNKYYSKDYQGVVVVMLDPHSLSVAKLSQLQLQIAKTPKHASWANNSSPGFSGPRTRVVRAPAICASVVLSPQSNRTIHRDKRAPPESSVSNRRLGVDDSPLALPRFLSSVLISLSVSSSVSVGCLGTYYSLREEGLDRLMSKDKPINGRLTSRGSKTRAIARDKDMS